MSDDIIKRLRGAIAAGPTPGYWDADFASAMRNGSPAVVEYFVRRDGDDISIAADIVDPSSGLPSAVNANYIAAASPDNIAALLDRLDDLETNGAQAVRWAPSSAHWSNELKRLFGSDARGGVDNLERQLRDMTARLDAAKRECERLRSESKAQLEELGRIDDALGTNEGPSAVDHIMILKTENEQLREDAERYRWLRGREDGRYMTVYAFRTDVDEVCLGEELDATIDAAMATEQSDERSEK